MSGKQIADKSEEKLFRELVNEEVKRIMAERLPRNESDLDSAFYGTPGNGGIKFYFNRENPNWSDRLEADFCEFFLCLERAKTQAKFMVEEYHANGGKQDGGN